MRLEPFVQVDDTPFSASREDIVRVRGQPLAERRNNVALTELDYGDAVFRFEDSGRLEEITMKSPVLHWGPVAIPFANLAAFICAHDGDAFERAGFLVSPAFGLAFVPRQPDWVTALARHCLPQWRAL